VYVYAYAYMCMCINLCMCMCLCMYVYSCQNMAKMGSSSSRTPSAVCKSNAVRYVCIYVCVCMCLVMTRTYKHTHTNTHASNAHGMHSESRTTISMHFLKWRTYYYEAREYHMSLARAIAFHTSWGMHAHKKTTHIIHIHVYIHTHT